MPTSPTTTGRLALIHPGEVLMEDFIVGFGITQTKVGCADRRPCRPAAGVCVIDWREDRVRAALEGRNPTVIAEMDAAYAVIGDVRFLPGYALALTKVPGVDHLSDLPRRERVRYLADVDLLAGAVESVCKRLDPAYRRLNIEILGNTDAFLHCHIWPRYEWEPAEIIGRPVWSYSVNRWSDPGTALGPQHDELRATLTAEVVSRLNSAEFRHGV
jgi:diadenosine tetraphosphate (Ap4A) HIT family hydrolase